MNAKIKMFIVTSMLLLSTGKAFSYQADGDGDYMLDFVENYLAAKFRPKLYMDAGDLAYFYPERGYNIPFSVDIYKLCETNRLAAAISYGICFTYDVGSFGHAGDTEFCQILIQQREGYTIEQSLADTSAWEIISRKCFGHLGTSCQETASQLTYSIPPIFWISEGKHAIYLDQSACYRPQCDDGCINNNYIYYDDENYIAHL